MDIFRVSSAENYGHRFFSLKVDYQVKIRRGGLTRLNFYFS